MTSRNRFERNKPKPQDVREELEGKQFVLLSPLPEGKRYELKKLDDGNTAIVVEGGEEEEPLTAREKFERRYHG